VKNFLKSRKLFKFFSGEKITADINVLGGCSHGCCLAPLVQDVARSTPNAPLYKWNDIHGVIQKDTPVQSLHTACSSSHRYSSVHVVESELLVLAVGTGLGFVEILLLDQEPAPYLAGNAAASQVRYTCAGTNIIGLRGRVVNRVALGLCRSL
jgi:hypothetical protein